MPEDDENTYTGTCRSGPMNGHELTIRAPEGILAVDVPDESAWVYHRRHDDDFELSLDDDESVIDAPDGGVRSGRRHLDRERAVRTAFAGRYDVVALPGEEQVP